MAVGISAVSPATLRTDLMAVLPEYPLTKQFQALKIMPPFRTAVASSNYPIIPTEALLKQGDTLTRSAASAYTQVGWTFENGTFTCVEYGIEVPVDDAQAKMYANYFDAEKISAGKGLLELRIAQEKRVADMLVAATSMSGASSVSWATPASAVPITDIGVGKAAIYAATGLMPNTLVVGRTLYNDLCVTSQILDRVKYISPMVTYGEIPTAQLAQVLGLDQVLVLDAVYDSAAAGDDNTVIANVWSTNYAVLCRCATNPQDLSEPCIGRTFVFEADAAGDVIVESYRNEIIRSNVIRCRHYVDEVGVMDSLRYRLTAIH